MNTTEVTDILATIWTEQLAREFVEADDDFVASGGTSIGAVHLAATIQERLVVAIDAIEILEQATFGKLCDLVTRRAQTANY